MSTEGIVLTKERYSSIFAIFIYTWIDNVFREAEAKLWYEGDAIPYNTTGSIGVVKAESTAINYEGPKGLRLMLEGDDSAVRDIQIGWHNARAVETDLGGRSVESYHWVPVTKPSEISKRNPSDII